MPGGITDSNSKIDSEMVSAMGTGKDLTLNYNLGSDVGSGMRSSMGSSGKGTSIMGMGGCR